MSPAKVPLVCLPTPLHRLDHLSAELGLDLWIKRDDLTGFALGGNKGRKLEYLIGAALEANASVVVTCGGIQSNFIRQLGAACSVHGLRCVAAVMELPFEDEPAVGVRLDSTNGNVILDELLGVELNVFPDDTWETLYDAAEQLAVREEANGNTVYRVPIGGSSPLGAYAFYSAAEELKQQLGRNPDWIVTASSSGSTQTGLTYGFQNTATKVLGICSDPEPEMVDDFADLGEKLAPLIGVETPLSAESFDLNVDFVGDGYGIPSEAGNNAIRELARKEGIFLDPVYSGKAFAALLALARSEELSGTVVFWHTGGVPTLFAQRIEA